MGIQVATIFEPILHDLGSGQTQVGEDDPVRIFVLPGAPGFAWRSHEKPQKKRARRSRLAKTGYSRQEIRKSGGNPGTLGILGHYT